VFKEISLWISEKLAAGGRGLIAGISWLWQRFKLFIGDVSGQTWRRVAVLLPVFFAIYILLGMAIVQRVDDTLATQTRAPKGGAETVAMTAWLINRETRDHNWTPNDPWIYPGWWVDNTPNFQRGLLGALSRFSIELRDHIGRQRGSSAVDKDLESAAGNLAREPDRWMIDFSTSLLPTTPSDSYYREAARKLEAYNSRLAQGDAIFDRRTDNLMATLDRIALDLGASSAALDDYIRDRSGSWFVDYGSDDLFFQVKGQVYAYTMLLHAMKADYTKVLADKELETIYNNLLASMEAATRLSPLYVSNGAVDGITPNHLAMQGFYLLRARTQLREVTNILLK